MGDEGEGRYQKSQVMRHGLLTVVDVHSKNDGHCQYLLHLHNMYWHATSTLHFNQLKISQFFIMFNNPVCTHWD